MSQLNYETATVPDKAATTADTPVQTAVSNACSRMAPLWPLSNFVAVNPFIGLMDMPFQSAMELVQRVTGAAMIMDRSYYGRKFSAGEIPVHCLNRAIETWSTKYSADHNRFSKPPTVAEMTHWINAPFSGATMNAADWKHSLHGVQTAADLAEKNSGIKWRDLIVEEIAKWCAAYYDWGQALICPIDRSQSLFPAWKAIAQADRSAGLMGLTNFRVLVSELPNEAQPAIEKLIHRMGIADWQLTDYFHRLLMDVAGWSGHIQYRAWPENGKTVSHELPELLAMRLAYDSALALTATTGWTVHRDGHSAPTRRVNESQLRYYLNGYLWMRAAELAYEEQILKSLRQQFTAGTPEPQNTERPSLQAVFCIDVRSERFRRNLESLYPGAQTIGFAGFFGFPVEYVELRQDQGSPLCPVLIKPPFKVHQTLQGASAAELLQYKKNKTIINSLTDAWADFKSSAMTSFTFVEAIGLAFGPKLAVDGLLRRTPGDGTKPHAAQNPLLAPDLDSAEPAGLNIDQQVNLAAGALQNMGLTDQFARLVVICGHGSGTTNNPYGSSLDCGACGGHRGDINARIVTAVLNKIEVRHALRSRGIDIPNDTWFIAAMHNTTTDEVVLLDTHMVPPSHQSDMDSLVKALSTASHRTRQERSEALGIKESAEMTVSRLKAIVEARSTNWAQIRPEWGLAGNAAFIAAPRRRTETINLNGRVFLHDYQWNKDPDLAVLRLILSAPMVVANWINMQYFASTVSNDVFGSGSKLLHNVVGTHGVCLGNAGDLRCGLPLESVHDGTNWVHEPLRLLVIVETPRSRLDTIISSEPTVKKLVENQWVHLIAIEAPEPTFWRYEGGGAWRAAEAC
ncbi:MAG: YbcC family protein [Phycisphaerae bacterium]